MKKNKYPIMKAIPDMLIACFQYILQNQVRQVSYAILDQVRVKR